MEVKGDFVFSLSTLFTNPKGPKEQVQAQCSEGRLLEVRQAIPSKYCLAARPDKSENIAHTPLLPSPSYKSLATARLKCCTGIYSKHIYWNIKHNRSKTMLEAVQLAPSKTGLHAGESGLSLGWEDRQLAPPEGAEAAAHQGCLGV